MIYPKGAFILHMLRMMMFDRTKGGDAQFQAMMKDFVQTHFNQDVSTEDFKKIVEKHITKEMDVNQNGKMDWFFDAWVYGTEIPSYQYTYQIGADGSLSGKIIQSGVSDKFTMLVPIYVDFGKGWMKLGSATVTGNSTFDIPKIDLPKGLKRSSINAFQDVLTVSVQQSK
jgi:aminopeptidase N